MTDREIERDTMLEHFGYRVETMSSDAKNSRARHMERVHGFKGHYLTGKNVKHYWLSEVLAAKERNTPKLRAA